MTYGKPVSLCYNKITNVGSVKQSINICLTFGKTFAVRIVKLSLRVDEETAISTR